MSKIFQGQLKIGHVHEESNKDGYELCTICDKKYANVRNHINSIHRENVDKCGLCDNYFSDLQDHEGSVHDGKLKKFQCTICDFKCFKKDEVEKHEEIVHLNMKQRVDKVTTCQLCDKEYKQKYNLLKHIKREHKD